MRVLRVIARMNVGGPAHHVSLLARRLPSHGYEQLLVAGRVGAGEAEHPDAALAVRVGSLTPALRPFDDLRALLALVRLTRTYRPDLVHTHTAKAGVLGRLAARLALGRRPLVVHTYHGHVLEGYFGRAVSLAYRMLESALARTSDALVGVSTATVDDLVRLRVAPRDRFRVVPLGLDLSRFLVVDREATVRREWGIADEEVLVVFTGRLVPIKRVDVLLRAVAAARAAGAHVRLAVVGGGPLESRLEALAQELGLDGVVLFAGYRADTDAILASADLAALASDNEGTPVALIEAAAAGVPCVTTDAGGVRDVVATGAGTVVPCGDHAALGAAMAAWAADADHRRRAGQIAREHVRSRYAAERLVADLDALYRELAANRVA